MALVSTMVLPLCFLDQRYLNFTSGFDHGGTAPLTPTQGSTDLALPIGGSVLADHRSTRGTLRRPHSRLRGSKVLRIDFSYVSMLMI